VHPTEATLLALVHGELAGDPAAEVETHLDTCPSCQESFARLRAGDTEVADLLSMLDHSMPRLKPPQAAVQRQRLRPAILAASLALLIAGAAAAAVPGMPLHHWIWQHLAPAAEPQIHRDAAPVPAPVPKQAASGIEVPVSGGLTIAFTAPEQGGTLIVGSASRPDLSLRAYGGAVAYRVGAERILVENRGPAAHYVLEVPNHLQRLTVLLGSRVIYQSANGRRDLSSRDTVSLSTDGARQ
jgi:anti-sigma factor RsiW